MPRRTLQINDFSQGQNTALDPEDLAPDEMEIMQNCTSDSLGRIRNQGKFITAAGIDTDLEGDNSTQVAYTPGKGLFAFSHDAETMDWRGVNDIDALATYNGGCDNMPNCPPGGSGTDGCIHICPTRSEELIPLEKNRLINASSNWTEYSPNGSAPTFVQDYTTDERLEITPGDATHDEGAKLNVSYFDGGYGSNSIQQYKGYRLSFDCWRASGENNSMACQFGGSTSACTFTFGIDATQRNYEFYLPHGVANHDIRIYQQGTDNGGVGGDTTQFYITNISLKTGGQGAVLSALIPGGNDKIPSTYNPGGDTEQLNVGVLCPGWGYSDNEKLVCDMEDVDFTAQSSTGTAGTGFIATVDKTGMVGGLKMSGAQYLAQTDSGSTQSYKSAVDLKTRFWNSNDGWVKRKDNEYGGWSSGAGLLYTDCGTIKAGNGASMVYYMVDGIIRTCHSDWDNLVEVGGASGGPAWIGYIKGRRYRFHGTTGSNMEHNVDQWFQGDPGQSIWGPSDGKAFTRNDTYGGAFTGQDCHIRLYTITASEENTYGSGYGWGGKKWQIAYSYVIDGTQETPLYECPEILDMSNTGTDMFQTSTKAKVQIYIDPGWNGANSVTSKPHPRVTNIKVYLREAPQSTGDPSVMAADRPRWYLAANADMYKGLTHETGTGKGRWQSTASQAVDQQLWCQTELMTMPPTLRTYETETGYDSDMHRYGLQAQYKTVAIANRRAYIGNVRLRDKSGEWYVRGDAIVKSKVNCFDSFPEKNVIETSTSDGDSIVALQAYADRLLIFKNSKLDILNIGQDIEFLEDSKQFMGVKIPNATCETPYGICFINKYGLYLYDGNQVHNLLENKKGIPRVDDEDWFDCITDSATICYNPLQKGLLIKPTHDNEAATYKGFLRNKFMYFYNFKLDTFTQAIDVDGHDGDHASNMVTLDDGRVLIGFDHYNIKEWVTSTRSAVPAGDYKLRTKIINFGDKSRRKKIYKVYVTFKSGTAGSQNVRVLYNKLCEHDHNCAYPGWSTGHTFKDGTNFTSNDLVITSTGEWNVAELKPSTSAIANNVKTFQLEFDSNGGAVPADFEISDIQIVYREKSVK